ncbi:hypothetical protein CGRA01v4_09842 [Colletotrichum graminicola]|uniref:Uncharacterized protein n=1 Tax=Colletotrichum graminicola (strain M1.001 / M2 / FGSC 10212) TaxID=645133 RepID=E3QXQ5_COLGM|nr:uncharacterized protein GLRG_10802 [Colletotrichum graminicola M1.001]EFQ35658.1 hypothetical protein GLRG_10802 [Colletotrichum graminicola M1.001]WDK18557.1 hypothetical protein CGRA01v4_09842 [Colletotrichum graminicola]
MDPNAAACVGGEAADSRTSAGDPFMKMPFELRKSILDDLDNRRDVYAISRASPIMAKTARGTHGILEQLLETELGPAQLRALLPDALAALMFPTAVWYPSDAAKKAAILQHIRDWKSNRLGDRAGDDDKVAAHVFIHRLAIPFAEDFAALTGTVGKVADQIRLPAWAYDRRYKKAPRPAVEIWRYEPEERVRLLRAFCRFELLSKVISARPGAQLWTLTEQFLLLNALFEAWEVEEVFCVQMYVGEMHTILFETHVVDVLDTMSSNSIRSRLLDPARVDQSVRLSRGPFDDYYEVDDEETEWFTKIGPERNPGTPCAKFELAGYDKHATFVKQTATFGLAFLKHFLRSDAPTYSRWIRAHGHVLLNGMADPDEAEYVGPYGTRSDVDGGVLWLSFRVLDTAQLDGGNAAVRPLRTNADLAYIRHTPDDVAANTAWRHLDATNPQLREAFRRCGWVFWSDARLRRNVFWNRRLDVFSPGAAPRWLHRPDGRRGGGDPTAIATSDEDDEDEDEDEYFLPRSEIDDNMAFNSLGGAPFVLGLSSAAEAKLLSFLGENLVRRGIPLFREYPFDRFRGERIPLAVWEECMGGADPAVPAGAVEVFDGIFWG